MDLSGFWARIRLGRALRELDRELDEELEDHFSRVVEDGLRRGMDLPSAVEEGRRSLGQIGAARGSIRREDRVRAVRTWADTMIPRLLAPATDAIRSLRRRPAEHVRRLALYTVGVSALAALWALTAPVRNLAPRSATELLRLDVEGRYAWGGEGVVALEDDWVSGLLGHPDMKGAVVVWAIRDMELGPGDERLPVRVRFTTSDYFQVLHTRPASGRLLEPGDARRPVVPVVASQELQRRLSRDVVGALLELDDVPVEVVGVTEPGFLGGAPDGFDLVVPIEATSSISDLLGTPGGPAWDINLSLAVQVDRQRAARARAIALEMLANVDGFQVTSVNARPWYGSAFSPSVYHSRGVALLLGVAALTYFLTVLNGWTLEGATRARRGVDSAVRSAVGASPVQLLGRDVIIGAVLGMLAGVVAFLPAQWISEWVRAGVLSPAVGGHALGGGIALFRFAVVLGGITSAMTVLLSRVAAPDRVKLFGPPALRMTLRRDEPWLVAGVVAQAGMVMMIGVAVAFLGRAAVSGSRMDMGIEVDRLWTVQFRLVSGGQPSLEQLDRAQQAARGLDGVEAAVWSAAPPFGFLLQQQVEVSGPEGSDTVAIRFDVVSPGFFDAVGTPLVAGPELDAGAGAPRVVANQAFVDRYLGGTVHRDVCLRFPDMEGRDAECQTIAGLTHGHVDGRRTGSLPKIYFVEEGPSFRYSTLILRTADGLTPRHQTALRAAVSVATGSSLRAEWSSLREASLEDLEPVVRLLRVVAVALLLALGVALAGLTSVVSLFTSRRETDFALRLALGARAVDLVWEGLARVLRWLAAGAITGVLAFPLISPVLELDLTDGSGAGQVWMVVSVLLIVMFGLCMGSLGPIWRASRISPSRSLREGG